MVCMRVIAIRYELEMAFYICVFCWDAVHPLIHGMLSNLRSLPSDCTVYETTTSFLLTATKLLGRQGHTFLGTA